MVYYIVDENEEVLFICHTKYFAELVVERIKSQVESGMYKMEVKIKEVG